MVDPRRMGDKQLYLIINIYEYLLEHITDSDR